MHIRFVGQNMLKLFTFKNMRVQIILRRNIT